MKREVENMQTRNERWWRKRERKERGKREDESRARTASFHIPDSLADLWLLQLSFQL